MFLKLLLLLFFVCCNAQEITGPDSPVPTNTNVTYMCTSPFGRIFWAIGLANGEAFQFNGEERVADAASRLRIFVDLPQPVSNTAIVDTNHNNGTVLLCQIEVNIIEGVNSTSSINITTYGLPFLPSDFSVAVNESGRGFLLSWIPGFSFDTEMVTYLVNVGGAEPSISQSETERTSLFLSSSSDMRVCPEYNFTLQVKNAVGINNLSLITRAFAPTALSSLEEVTQDIVLGSGAPSLTLTFMDVSPCEQYRVVGYTLVLSESMNARGGTLAPPFTVSPLSVEVDQMDVVTITVDSNILPDRKYQLELTAISNVSSTQANLILYTTGLQGVFAVVDGSVANFTCVFTIGSTALGCEVLRDDGISLQRINVRAGEDMAMGVVTLPAGVGVGDIVVVEVLATGELSAIQIEPVTEDISTTALTTELSTEDDSSRVTVSVSTDSGQGGSSGLALEGGVLYAIIGIAAAVCLFLLLIIIVVIFIVRANLRKKARRDLRTQNGDELKANYLYGGPEASVHICTSAEFTSLEVNKQQACENQYDTADVPAASNGKASAPIPTYATVESARHETLLAGGPAVLNPVYGPGSSISPATSPVPVPTANNNKHAPNPIYSEAYASKGKPPTSKEGIVVSGLNPVYGGVGSLASSTHSQGEISPRYTNSSELSKAHGLSPLSPSSSGASSTTPLMPPLYEELKPVKLSTVPRGGAPTSSGPPTAPGPPTSPGQGFSTSPSQDPPASPQPPTTPRQGPPNSSGQASPNSPLTANQSYGIFNSNANNLHKP